METINEIKQRKFRENEEKRGKINKIRTSIGYVKTKTKVGNLRKCLQELVPMVQNKGRIRKNFLTFCDEFGEIFEYEPLDKEEAVALCKEISEEYGKIDKKYLNYKNKIENAKTSRELEEITIEYWT